MKEKEKEIIREIIREELKSALVREITVEKGPRKQGDPEKRIETEIISVLDFLCIYLPKIEAALRGMQADIDRTKNNINRNNESLKKTINGLELVAKTLIDMERTALTLAAASDEIKALGMANKERAQVIQITDGRKDEGQS